MYNSRKKNAYRFQFNSVELDEPDELTTYKRVAAPQRLLQRDAK